MQNKLKANATGSELQLTISISNKLEQKCCACEGHPIQIISMTGFWGELLRSGEMFQRKFILSVISQFCPDI